MAETDPRLLARSLFDAGVAAADPARAVRHALADAPLAALAPGGRYVVIAVGKAASAMMAEALRHLPAETTAVAVTNYENAQDVAGCQVLAAGHPTPDENGHRAAAAVMAAANAAGPNDLVVCLISGGGSALLPMPVPGVSLADKIATNDLLLANGFAIEEVNLVRQNLSVLKGGGLARAAHPAAVRALIVSDVIGDDVRVIASGPTAAPIGSARDASRLLDDRGLWAALPAAVARHLAAAPAAPEPTAADNAVVGSNTHSVQAVAAAAPPGCAPRIVSTALTGDVGDAAAAILAEAHAMPSNGQQLLIWGGETTVTLRGTGQGGRNQELALRVAIGASELPGRWAFLSGGTDGRDGPTSAAGGVVDARSVSRITAAGLDPVELLADNDSNRALAAAGDLLITGATGTNVADIQILVRV